MKEHKSIRQLLEEYEGRDGALEDSIDDVGGDEDVFIN
jgi:hypothetical protein